MPDCPVQTVYRCRRGVLGELRGLPKFVEMVGLNFEQAGFHGGGAAQPP
jgi:hypothetical protein